VLQSYLPALVFLGLAGIVGTAMAFLNGVLGPRRPTPVKQQPYECGLPSEVKRGFRFGISFYLVAILFLLFDIEVVLVYPVALQLAEFGVAALVKIAIFVGLLAVAFAHQWRRGALEWR
jgi:NADH-quinone oxidoreductase subunit A